MTNKKEIKVLGNNNRENISENKILFQELREIKNEVKEVKKFLIINSLHHLVKKYDKQEKNKSEKWEKDIELANKDEQRNKEIAEWDRIQEEDDEKLIKKQR